MTRRPVILTLVGVVALVGSITIAGAASAVKSSTTLTIGYGFFKGNVSSPSPACKGNRRVSVFRDVAGADVRVAQTLSNQTGAWATFRKYQQGTFYARVAARTQGSLTCKAAMSVFLPAPIRVTEATQASQDWMVDTFACGPDLPIGGYARGPGTPPLGFGSVKLQMQGGNTNFAGWSELAGSPLASLARVRYSTYVTTGPHAPILAISLSQPPGAFLLFRPHENGTVNLNKWQSWAAAGTSMWDTDNDEPSGTTLAAFKSANPGAIISSVFVTYGCLEPDQTAFIDKFVAEGTFGTQIFDFED